MKKIEFKKLGETIYYDECECGLPIYLWVNERVSNFYATLSVKYGSIDTKFKVKDKEYTVPNGIAHFLEHVKFNESADTTAHDYFNKLGASINAFTTFEYTSYEVYGTENLKEDVTHLLDYVYTPYFTDKATAKEKGIIIEEVKMGANRPTQQLYYQMNNNLFHQDNRRFLVTGTEEDVKSITADDIKLVYNTFYHPKNMFLVITGNFNPYEIASLVKEVMRKKNIPKYLNPVKIYAKEEESVVNKEQDITGNVAIPKIRISYKIPKKRFKKYSDLDTLTYLRLLLNANFGATSDLRADLLEKELITKLGTESYIVGDYVIISLVCETKYPHELEKILINAMNNLSITKTRLSRRAKCNYAEGIYGFDDIEYVNTMVQDFIIHFNGIDNEYFERIKNLNIDIARDILKSLKLDNYSILTMEPEE